MKDILDKIFSAHIYSDTNPQRSKFETLNEKFLGQKIAIIGLGGTGSYILDFVSKTPVECIDIYDDDDFDVHNAFRAPGAPSINLFKDKLRKKVDYLFEVYSEMKNDITPIVSKINMDNIQVLMKYDFVFLAIDNETSKNPIIMYLLDNKVPFVDSGIGINKVDDSLIGLIRCTNSEYFKENKPEVNPDTNVINDNEYNSSIQIAELNSLAAILSIIEWKKHLGFYYGGYSSKDHCINLESLKNENED